MFKKISGYALLVCVCIFTVGCATQKKMTREEYLKMTNRTYEDVSEDNLLKAAEKLFYLSDGDDFTFHHAPKGLTAIRPWSIYLILAATNGTDVWTVQVNEQINTKKINVSVYGSTAIGGSIMPMVGAGGGGSVIGVPGAGGGIPMSGTAIYELFWSRLDYLLGKTQKWKTCDEIEEEIQAGKLWGNIESFCSSFNVKDNLPEELRGKQRE